jgi:hypothetical protein
MPRICAAAHFPPVPYRARPGLATVARGEQGEP